MHTVQAFITDNQEEIQGMRGYPRLCADLEYYSVKFTLPMANTMLLKNLLANEYGTVTNVALAKLCRVWLRTTTEH